MAGKSEEVSDIPKRKKAECNGRSDCQAPRGKHKPNCLSVIGGRPY